MIKEIEELQEDIQTIPRKDAPLTPAEESLVDVALTLAGIAHQLAVKVERLERRTEKLLLRHGPRVFVPDSEEGGL